MRYDLVLTAHVFRSLKNFGRIHGYYEPNVIPRSHQVRSMTILSGKSFEPMCRQGCGLAGRDLKTLNGFIAALAIPGHRRSQGLLLRVYTAQLENHRSRASS